MTARNIIAALLLIFALGSIVYTLSIPRDSLEASPTRPSKNTTIAVEGVAPDYAVYFFYNDIYCTTCEKLENYALQAIQVHYADELKLGLLQWRTLDMTAPENKHYVVDFGLYSKSIVLLAFNDGELTRFKNLEDIWDRIDNQEDYAQYIRTSLETFMHEAS